MKKEKVLNSNEKNLNDNEIESVTGGINRQAVEGYQHISSRGIGGVHIDPNESYNFTCRICHTSFSQSGVGDDTAVRCPDCGKNVR